MRTVLAVTLGLVGILVFEGCGSDGTTATSSNNPYKPDASASGGFYNGSGGGTPSYSSGGDTSGATGGDTSGSTGGDTTASSGGDTAQPPTCDPGFCPSAGTGMPCCTSNTCGLDFGMGCVILVPDGGP